jgi:hypothetical protein
MLMGSDWYNKRLREATEVRRKTYSKYKRKNPKLRILSPKLLGSLMPGYRQETLPQGLCTMHMHVQEVRRRMITQKVFLLPPSGHRSFVTIQVAGPC